MSKNKFFKKLLIGGLCALTATAMIGATACQPGNGDDNDPNGVHQTNEYTVSFNLDGGSWSLGESYTVKVENGGKLSSDLEKPTKDGKVFDGWYDGDTLVIAGLTAINKNVTLTAKWKDPEVNAKSGLFTVSNSATDTYEAGGIIDDNELFTLKAGVASEYSKGKDGADLGVSGSNAEGGYTANQAIKQSSNVTNGSYEKSLYTITAKANANIKVYVQFVNDSWNSDRAGAKITYSLGSDAVYTIDSVKRTEALRCINVSIPEGETLTIGASNTSGNDAKLWLFCVEGEEEVENTVAVNYYYGQTEVEEGEEAEDLLIATQYVASGAELVAPKDPEVIGSTDAFKGWYDAATGGTQYTFGTLAADTTEVNLYAQYLVSDVTITFYGADNETVYKTVYGFSGQTVAKENGPATTDGSTFLYWSTTVGGEQYNFDTVLTAGTLALYPVYEAAAADAVIGHTLLVTSQSNYTIKSDKDDNITLATVTLNGGAFQNKTVEAGAYTATVRWQSDASSGGKVLDLVLEEGYTYTVQLYAGSSGSAGRVLSLMQDASTVIGTGTGAGGEVAGEVKFTDVAAGTYYITQDANVRLYLIVIHATPVNS